MRGGIFAADDGNVKSDIYLSLIHIYLANERVLEQAPPALVLREEDVLEGACFTRAAEAVSYTNLDVYKRQGPAGRHAGFA